MVSYVHMKTNKTDKINKICASWEPLGEIPTVYPCNTYKMKKMQNGLYKFVRPFLSKLLRLIVNAPTASGKTLAICWIVAKILHMFPNIKAIISVPQTIIADGFKGYFNLNFTNENGCSETPIEIAWSPIHYFISNAKESNINQIFSFLNRLGNINDLNDRIAICTHATLIDTFHKHHELLKDIIIVIDEAHHIQYTHGQNGVEAEGDEDKTPIEYCNQMGSLVSYALKNEDKNIGLILSTATLFRGDRLEVIPKSLNDKFVRYYYPMDKYLEDCHWLKSFSYDFAMYENQWGDRLKKIFNDSIGKTIIYLPSVGSKYYSYGAKQQDLKEIYKSIAAEPNFVTKDMDNGLTLIKKGQKWIKVVNLVDDSNIILRNKRKELIISAHKHKDGSLIDVVITLNMFREGANWKWADREIIIGSKGSLTDMNQILGRLLRDAEGKEHVHAIQLLPFSFDQLDKEKFKYHLNEYSKVIFATMLFEDAISPVNLNIPLKKKETSQNKPEQKCNVDYLRMQIGDENEILSIIEEIRNAAIICQDNGEVNFGNNNETTRNKFAEIVSEILTNHGVKKHHSEISETIRIRWIIESIKKIPGIDLKGVDFNIIDINPLDFWLTYTSSVCGLDTFRKFRKAIVKYFYLPYEEAREISRKATKDYGFTTVGEYKDWVRGKRKDLPSAPEGMPLDLKVYGRVYN